MAGWWRPCYRRVMLVVGLLALIAVVLWQARGVLFPYLLGLLLVYLLEPLVSWGETGICWLLRRWRRAPRWCARAVRPVAVLVVYLVTLGVLTGFVAMIVPVIVDQAQALWSRRYAAWNRVRGIGERVLEQYHLLPPEIRAPIEENLAKLGNSLTEALGEGVWGTVVVVSNTVSWILGLVVIPFWLFYLLKDYPRFKAAIWTQLSPDLRNLLALLNDVLSAYFRGQLVLCLIIAVLSTIALLILGVDYALLLGVVAGLFELVPFIGPILGAVPAVLVALLQEPVRALWVMVAFFLIQQVENLFLVPRVTGESVKLHPALVMVVLVVGSEVAGLWGVLLAVPVTAALRDVFKYLYLRWGENPVPPDEARRRVYRESMRLEV